MKALMTELLNKVITHIPERTVVKKYSKVTTEQETETVEFLILPAFCEKRLQVKETGKITALLGNVTKIYEELLLRHVKERKKVFSIEKIFSEILKKVRSPSANHSTFYYYFTIIILQYLEGVIPRRS